MSITPDPFEEAIFTGLANTSARTAKKTAPLDLTARLQPALSFDHLKQAAHGRIRVAFTESGYHINLGTQMIAADLRKLLAQDNPGIQLEFTEDFNNYEPNPDLIKKSKVPLWVIKPTGTQSVLIQRMW